MIFSSFSFITFFLALLAIYSVLTKVEHRAGLLLAGSILFYLSWEPLYLSLLGSSLYVNHKLYLKILFTRSRVLLILGIIINLSVLGVFKYIGFISETGMWFAHLVDGNVQVERPQWADWVLPLGISFFTFQMLSALIDAYRGEWKRAVGFYEWSLYVTFFPQLIAGPIVRAHQLFNQLENLKPLSMANLRMGASIFVGGLIKKALFADNLAPIVDRLYAHPEQLDFYLSWLGTSAFGMQIYLDFSGYSEMAVGLAWMLGIQLPRNFRYPYISRNFSEFWTRWHITLSQWLRDYLYIPLGGSRGSLPRTYYNLMVTMLLGGLWHGAGWTFVFWGFMHGSYLIIYHALSNLYKAWGLVSRRGLGKIFSFLGWPLTFILTSFTWVFFRAPTFDSAWTISGSMLGVIDPPETLANVRMYETTLIVVAFAVMLIEPLVVDRVQEKGVEWWWVNIPFLIRGFVYGGLIMLLVVLGGDTQKFIYFDF